MSLYKRVKIEKTLVSHVLLGSGLGAVLGAIFFFNSTSFELFVVGTVGMTTFTGLVSGLISAFKTKGLIIGLGLGVVIGTLFLLTSSSCNFMDVMPQPAENTFTGEVSTEGFDGFRIMLCDKGQHPWYYEELSQEELENFCEETNYSSGYCSRYEILDRDF